jgi:hypothetical protein
MDRNRLERWLHLPTRTWRWNDGDRARYDAVETSGDGLVWFRWTHEFEDDGTHGQHDVLRQSFASYAADGPARAVPDSIRDEIDACVRDRVASPEPGPESGREHGSERRS